MKRAWLAILLGAAAALAGMAASHAGTPPTRESAATLVVFNNLDPQSLNLAAYYAKARSIPLDHLVGLACPQVEEITRTQYDETIAAPLRHAFVEHGWWKEPADPAQPVTENQIRFIALMRGIPLKIANTPKYAGDMPQTNPALATNAAAVDSELAVLGLRTRQISGPLTNIYYKSFTPFMDTPFAPLMLVCRLDAPAPRMVERMIDGAISAERTGLQGFGYVDLRGITSGNYALGDTWIATATISLRKHGMPVVWDSSPEVYPEDFPMKHAAFYLGWYAAGVSGPMARPDFTFEPGAVAVHIHSFSAWTLRDPTANWVGPLVAHGAAATLGNVYEPYLGLTPNLDIFTDRLKNGFTFAESAYAAQPVLSWMATFVGDPLYRPFSEAAQPADTPESAQYEACRRGARAWYEQGRTEGTRMLAESGRRMRSGIVWEGLGLLQWSIPDYDSAMNSFREAEKCYGHSEDAMRVLLHQAEIWRGKGRPDMARSTAARGLKAYREFHGTTLLRGIIGLPQAGKQ